MHLRKSSTNKIFDNGFRDIEYKLIFLLLRKKIEGVQVFRAVLLNFVLPVFDFPVPRVECSRVALASRYTFYSN